MIGQKINPLFLAMIAIESAFDAEYCFECAQQIKKGGGKNKPAE